MNQKELAQMPFEEFLKFVEHTVTTEAPKNKQGISLTFPVDLRQSMKMKKEICSAWHKWTAFLNNAGTMCHVISPDGDILARITFTYPIKHLSPAKQLEMIIGKVKNWIVI